MRSDASIEVSAAADSNNRGCGGVLDACQRFVDLERLSDVLGPLGSTDAGKAIRLAVEAANEGGTKVSAAADALGEGGRRRT